jgi:hypothetical protein
MKKNSSKKAEQETCFFLTFFSIDRGACASGAKSSHSDRQKATRGFPALLCFLGAHR